METNIFDPAPPKFKIQKMKIQFTFECTDVNSRTPGVSRSRRGPILSWLFSNIQFLSKIRFFNQRIRLVYNIGHFIFFKSPCSSEKRHFCDRMIKSFPRFCYEIFSVSLPWHAYLLRVYQKVWYAEKTFFSLVKESENHLD